MPTNLFERFTSNPAMLEAMTIMGIALIASVVIHYLIRWFPLAWAEKQNRTGLVFSLKAIRFPISVTILLIGLKTLIQTWGLSETLETLLPAIISTFNIVIWGQFLFRATKFNLKNSSLLNIEGSFIRPQTLPLLENVSAVIIIMIICYLLFITWNIDMSAWLASAGIVGIAVGFAAKDTIANLLSGIFILADSPYKINDTIVIDSGERGKVTQIGLRSTRILTADDTEINIPNAIIANGKIINESTGRHTKVRVRILVGVAYGSDIDQVKSLLLDEAAKEREVCKDPEPKARMMLFGPSSLDFELHVWIETPDVRGKVMDSLNCAIYKRFNQEGIEIPYSKQDIYIKSMPK